MKLSRPFLAPAVGLVLTLFAAPAAPGQPAPAAAATLPEVLAHHGGLARWRGFGGVEYDLRWKFGASGLADHQTFDLVNRLGLIVAGDGSYRVGNDGKEVWVAPNRSALAGGKTPPRFYVNTPFYFFAIPFVFADPGVTVTPEGRKMLGDQACDVARVTFGKNVGDSPEDYYLLYSDPATHEARLVAYVVTYPAIRGTKKMDELQPHALRYDEWQEADGLRVPRRGRFFNWDAGTAQPVGEPLGTVEYLHVKFTADPPDAARFARPAGAETDPLK